MNFETPEHSTEEEKKLAITSEMQGRLALRYYKFECDTSKILEWIDEYSPVFREAIETHPEYLDMYQDDPEGILDRIEEEIYKKAEA